MTNEPVIHNIFEPQTSTWQYIVADPGTKQAVIIDAVLDYNPSTATISNEAADALLARVKENGYKIVKILETHVHADHITASRYLQHKLEESQNLRPQICIGKRVVQVQEHFAKRYGIEEDEYKAVFDKLFDDDEVFQIGDINGKVIHLPGHTPDHLGYIIGSNVFCGDSMFNHDVGSARCDFPGGDATSLYKSAQKLLSLPDEFKIWTGHDYPPGGANERTEPLAVNTVAQQKKENKHLHQGVSEEDFIKWRTERDSKLSLPRLIHQSLQLNIRAGELPRPSAHGDRMVYIPLKTQGQ